MSDTYCRNENCIKSQECLRYQRKEGEHILFENICKEENNYEWFWGFKYEIIKGDENNGN